MSDVENAWAEYEFRRRVHFGLELLLSAFVDELISYEESTIERVTAEWAKPEVLPEAVSELTGWGKGCMAERVSVLAKQLRTKKFVDEALWSRDTRGLSTRARAIYALALILACRDQSSKPLRSGQFRNRQTPCERAFDLVGENPTTSMAAVLSRLLAEIVVPAHMATSLRKMSQGQKCSLRFFPEGYALHATGKQVNAGYSGDRLTNVLGMWADIGALERTRGEFAMTRKGQALLKQL
jgi:hypothetical protein